MGSATSRRCTTYTFLIITSIALSACGGTRTSDEQIATNPQASPAAPAPAPEPSPSSTPPTPAQQPGSGCPSASSEPTLRNLSANHSYTLTPAPNYTATSDSLDTQQLTDGRINDNALWHDTGTVGWRSVRPVTITIDLGEVHSVSEVRWHAAAGSDDVKWPAAINVFVSSDGRTFRLLGDLIAADSTLATLPTDSYRAHTLRFATAPVDARYVRLMADRDGSYVFVDEIEVLGPADGVSPSVGSCLPTNAKRSTPVEDTLPMFWTTRAQRRAILAVDHDAAAIAARLAALNLSSAERQRLTEQLGVATADAKNALSAGPLASSRLPLNTAHESMYAVAADAERTAGETSLSAWSANPWDPLEPLARPDGNEQPALSTALMRGERRALAFNVRTTSNTPLRIALRLALPGFAPTDVRLYRVNWTGNEASRWSAAELELLGDGSEEREVTLLPGVTQQIWLQVQPMATTPGRTHGTLALTTGPITQQLPFDVQVYTVRMPDILSTRFGGWDYANGSSGHAVTASNRTQLGDYLRSSHVDTPWATRRVLHWDHVTSSGTVIGPPDATALTQWLHEWPTASRYRVFLSVRDAIGAIPISDPRFDSAVAAWAQSWATQIRNLQKSPELFDLLLVDEPQSDAQAATTVAWARAIRNSGAGFRIWTDPHWLDPSAAPRDFLAAVDTLSIDLAIAVRAQNSYWDWARAQQENGKGIELYATGGPARLLDPYAYYRLAPWRAWSFGSNAVTLWSFSDTGGSGSDNEFAAHEYNYSPLFINGAQVRPGKHMEAAVEGLQDVEYLRMLAAMAAAQSDPAIIARIDDLLSQAGRLASGARADDPHWAIARERRRAEDLRVQAGELLDAVAR